MKRRIQILVIIITLVITLDCGSPQSLAALTVDSPPVLAQAVMTIANRAYTLN